MKVIPQTRTRAPLTDSVRGARSRSRFSFLLFLGKISHFALLLNFLAECTISMIACLAMFSNCVRKKSISFTRFPHNNEARERLVCCNDLVCYSRAVIIMQCSFSESATKKAVNHVLIVKCCFGLSFGPLVYKLVSGMLLLRVQRFYPSGYY